MPESPTLVRFLRRRAGSGLRVVGLYEDDRCRLEYRRDDLEETRVREMLAEIHRNLTTGGHDETLLRERLGSEAASVQLRESGVVLHLQNEQRGAIVSMERGVARNLDMFAQECLDVLTSRWGD
jgi:hypothetical protein